MSELVLRPRSATELVDAAFQVYRRAPLQFMVAVAVVYVPWLVIQLVFNVTITPTNLPDTGQIAWLSLVGILIFAIAGGVTALIARDVYLGRPLDVAEDFRELLPRIPTLILASVAAVVIVAIGTVVAVIPAAVVFALTGGQAIAVVAASVLFIVSGLYLFARFYAVRQIVVLEDAGVVRALGRASDLSKGLRFHIVGTLFLIGVLTIAVDVGVTLMLGMIPSPVLIRLGSTALAVIVGPL
ncbi:MAG TPA: hypothetical protein VFJ20_07860, partial [Gemmatimonadaceae bacterium]|nr:hypothetical protein [Gemmatimonadaceae bacterium]